MINWSGSVMINAFWNWILCSGYRVILSSSQKPSRSDYYSSGFDHHSGYGHSSYDHSGYDHSSYGGGYVDYKECCPLVVDNLTFVSLIGFIILATYFLRQAILLNIMGRRKRRDISSNNFNHGKILFSRLVSLYFSSFYMGGVPLWKIDFYLESINQLFCLWQLMRGPFLPILTTKCLISLIGIIDVLLCLWP